jgi:hypothetical protein
MIPVAIPVDIDTNVKTRDEAIVHYREKGYVVYESIPDELPSDLQEEFSPRLQGVSPLLKDFDWDFAAIRGNRKVVIVLGTAKTRSTLNLGKRMKACMAAGWEMDYFHNPD